MPPQIFIKIILPLLEVSNSVLLMITTVTNKYSLFHRVTETRDSKTGAMIFNKLVIKLQCDHCASLRKSCVHNLHLLPHWKDGGSTGTVGDLYGEEFKKIKDQESSGITDESEGGLIDAWQIDRLRKALRFVPDPEMPPNYVHICVDPQAGGTSGYAISAMTLYQGRFIVSYTPPNSSSMLSSIAFVSVTVKWSLSRVSTKSRRSFSCIEVACSRPAISSRCRCSTSALSWWLYDTSMKRRMSASSAISLKRSRSS